jgi:hypothetical protein
VSRCGKAFAWGRHHKGQLGLQTTLTEVNTPRRIEGLAHTTVLSLGAGIEHSVASTAEGHAYCWGFGVPTPRKVKIDAKLTLPKMRDGAAPQGMRRARPCVLEVACGLSHSAARTSDGDLFVWDASHSPRHVPLHGHRAVSVSAARYSTLAVTEDGHVYCCTEHWHAGWAPAAERVIELSQVSIAVAAEHHCAAIVELRVPPLPSVPRPPVDALAAPSDLYAGVSIEFLGGTSLNGTKARPVGGLPARLACTGVDEEDGLKDDIVDGSASETSEAGEGGAAASEGVPLPRQGLGVPSLSRLCEQVLMDGVSARGVLQQLYMADTIGAEALSTFALQTVRANLRLVMRKPLWTHLPAHLVSHLRLSLLRETLAEDVPRWAALPEADAPAPSAASSDGSPLSLALECGFSAAEYAASAAASAVLHSPTNSPSLSPTAWALPLARNGNLPTLNLRPFSFAARSVSPTLATWGWQYVQPGKTETFFGLDPVNIPSTACMAS